MNNNKSIVEDTLRITEEHLNGKKSLVVVIRNGDDLPEDVDKLVKKLLRRNDTHVEIHMNVSDIVTERLQSLKEKGLITNNVVVEMFLYAVKSYWRILYGTNFFDRK